MTVATDGSDDQAGRSVTVRPADAAEPEAQALLAAYWAFIGERFPPAANFALDVEGLRGPAVSFFIAERGGRSIGCAALKRSEEVDWSEVKSMYVAPEARGAGVADALYDAVEAAARAAGSERLYLETGDVLASAQRFYARRGFRVCGAFGGYPNDSRLVFMEKTLLSPPP